jgi:hypothetical protein
MTSSFENPPPVFVEEPSSVEERRALIERVAASEHFSRSARLRDFLLYVGKQSLKNGHAEINEQEIGVKVFGRDASYDRSQDNIVRVNATELRKRIELYFATDGADELLTIEIPRGGYKPVFHRRKSLIDRELESARQEEKPSPLAATPAPDRARPRWRIHLIWGTVSLLLVFVCILLLLQKNSASKAGNPWSGQPALTAFWSGFLHGNQQTDIVLPDDSASVIEDITRQPISLGDYMSGDTMRRIESSSVSADRKEDLEQIFRHNLITFGGVRAAQEIMAEIPAPNSSYLTLTRHYTADAMKLNNVVLIGGKKSNPWVHVFDERMNFITDYDDEHMQPFIRNVNPKEGEQTTYLGSHEENSMIGYSVIAYLPTPSRKGNAIILAGTDSDATSASSEFLTSEDKLEKFRSLLHTDRFPYFEVLLKTTRLSGTSFNAEVVAYRTYAGSQ